MLWKLQLLWEQLWLTSSLSVGDSPVADPIELVNLDFGEQSIRNTDAQLVQHPTKVIDVLKVRASLIVAEVRVENLLSFACSFACLNHRTEDIVERPVVAQCDSDLPAFLPS